MEDERRYRTRTGDERDSLPRSIYPSYAEPSYNSLASRDLLYPGAHRSSLDYEDIEPVRYRNYGLDDVPGLSARTESGVTGISGSGVNISNYLYPFEATYNVASTSDASRLLSPSIPEPLYRRSSSLQREDARIAEPVYGRTSSFQRDDAGRPEPVYGRTSLLQRDDARISQPVYGRASSLQKVEGLSSPDDSSMLFVDGLPKDCTRREVGHLFRPFIGFKDIRVVHKEPRRSGDKAVVLCFVEFDSPSCARTAMEALQGYQFDHKKVDSPVLKIHFAHFPFKPPSATDVR